MNIKLIM